MAEVDVYSSVLTATMFCLARASQTDTKMALSQVFCEKEVVTAKDALYDCDVEIGTRINRQKSDNRSKKDATIQDIIDGMVKMDKLEHNYRFVTDVCGLAVIPEILSALNGMSRMEQLERKLDEVLAKVTSNQERLLVVEQKGTPVSPVPELLNKQQTGHDRSSSNTEDGEEQSSGLTSGTSDDDGTSDGGGTSVEDRQTESTGNNRNINDIPLVPVYNSISGIRGLMSLVREKECEFVPPLATDNTLYSAKVGNSFSSLTIDIPDVNVPSLGEMTKVTRSWSRDSSGGVRGGVAGGASSGGVRSGGAHTSGARGGVAVGARSSAGVRGGGVNIGANSTVTDCIASVRGSAINDNRPIQGTKKSGGGVIRGNVKTRGLFIYGIYGSPSEEDMLEHFTTKRIDTTYIVVEKKSHPDARSASFKVTVPVHLYSAVKSGDIWDEHIFVRDYMEPRRRNYDSRYY